MQNKYFEASTILTNAQADFLSIGDRRGAAHCFQALGDNLRRQGNGVEAAVLLADARAQLLHIDDRFGAAQCAQSLGRILLYQSKYAEAESFLSFLMHALDQFLDIGFENEAASCAESLEESAYYRDHEESIKTSS